MADTSIRVHGEYIHDYRRDFTRVRDVTNDDALALLRESHYVNRSFDPADINFFLNKGFVVLSANGGVVTMLARQDYAWVIWTGAEVDVCRVLRVASLAALEVA